MTVEFPENYILVFTLGYQAMRYRMFNDQMQQFHGSKARFDLGRESYALYPQSMDVDLKSSQQRRDRARSSRPVILISRTSSRASATAPSPFPPLRWDSTRTWSAGWRWSP